MLVGHTPFHADSEYLVFQRIQRADYSFPPMDGEARALIEALLSHDPALRPGAEASAELQRHGFFGGLEGFHQLRRDPAPPRITRHDCRRRTNLPTAGPSQDAMDDSAPSSAECTPEVGQRFLTRHAEVLGTEADPFTSDEEDSDEKESPQFSLAVRPFASTMGADVPEVKEKRPHSSSQGQKPATRFTNPQWLQELWQRRVLLRGEDVCLSGKVVQRFFPCLRPRMLVLTNLPRLLLLDSRGRRLVKDVELLDSSRTTCMTMRQGLRDNALSQRSPTEFELRLGGRRLRCRDGDLGAETWLDEIAAARQRLTLSRSSLCCPSPSSSGEV